MDGTVTARPGSSPANVPNLSTVAPVKASGVYSQPGGTGGGVSTSNVGLAGASGGDSLYALGGAGGAISTGGSIGTSVGTIIGENIFGGGGGGGGGSNTTDAGAGANGGNYGAGGGGGGASTDSVGNSGAGGNGADGYLVVVSFV